MKVTILRKIDSNTYVVESESGQAKLQSLEHYEPGDVLEGQFTTQKDPFHGDVLVQTGRIQKSADAKMKAVYALCQVPGVGKITAQRIVEVFGDKTLEVIQTDPDKLFTVKGLRKNQREAIVQHVRLLKAVQLISDKLPHLSYQECVTLAKTAVQLKIDSKIEEDPCYLVLYGDGINPKRIAQPDSPLYKHALIVYELQKAAMSEKQTTLSAEELAQRTKLDTRTVETILQELQNMNVTQRVSSGYTLAKLAHANGKLAMFLKRNLRLGRQGADTLREEAMRILNSTHKDLNDMQKQAVVSALTRNVCIVTGGPGTGKSATIEAIYAVGRALGFSVVVLAPTGKAAQRLRSVGAVTIHAAIGWDGMNANRKLDCDIVVVDEASMVDSVVLGHLLNAMDRATLVLVGDANQLPPVSYGAPFHTLIQLRGNGLSCVELVESYRNSEEVAKVAQCILKGDVSGFMDALRNGTNVKVVRRDNEQELLELLSKHYEKAYLTKGLDGLYESLLVLSPFKSESKTTLSTHKLNNTLGVVLGFAPNTLSKGVRVVQLVNDYEKGVMNGEVGTVGWNSELELEVNFPAGPVQYSHIETACLDRAFALTVHKSQGSEAETTWLVLPENAYGVMSKHLLYTAVTRAKSKFVLFGTGEALDIKNLHAVFGKTSQFVDGALLKEVIV